VLMSIAMYHENHKNTGATPILSEEWHSANSAPLFCCLCRPSALRSSCSGRSPSASAPQGLEPSRHQPGTRRSSRSFVSRQGTRATARHLGLRQALQAAPEAGPFSAGTGGQSLCPKAGLGAREAAAGVEGPVGSLGLVRQPPRYCQPPADDPWTPDACRHATAASSQASSLRPVSA
jgi:hypothetical protein